MSAGDEEEVPFSFYVPRDLNSERRRFVARYKDTYMEVRWTDTEDGQRQFQSVLDSIPAICRHIRQEISIKREVAQIDKDLEDLTDD